MIGDRIRDIRLIRGFTQESFAELLGMTIRQISRYETNDGVPSIETVIKIAKALNISADYILGITDVPKPFNQIDLSEREQTVISAWRHGDKLEAVKVLVNEG